jgi:calcium-dependent protein kinase
MKIIDYGLADFTAKIQDTAREVKVEKTGLTGKIARMLPTVNGKHIIPAHERRKVMVRAGTPHYMAPEMIEHQWYDQKADLFSIGIILCQLLTGWHPFHIQQVDDEASVRRKIADPTPVVFPRDIFGNVSPEAQDLCQKLLEKDPKNRLSAKQALEHVWFQDPSKPTPYGDKGGLSMSIFDGLMKYQAYNKLKRAVLQLLTRELSEYQIQELRKKFNALDSTGDGLLSPEDLIAGMRHIGYEMTEGELANIMASLDGTGGQQIGYKEFISALIERRMKFDRSQLYECFKKFDANNTGRIAYEDVTKLLQSNAGDAPGITQSEWEEIAAPANRSTGKPRVELTFEEFLELMTAET